jgi:hypothetical protein
MFCLGLSLKSSKENTWAHKGFENYCIKQGYACLKAVIWFPGEAQVPIPLPMNLVWASEKPNMPTMVVASDYSPQVRQSLSDVVWLLCFSTSSA